MEKRETLVGLIRISLGLTFLWAFFDKLLGLGFATAKEAAWIAGGSPTSGFLTFAAKGPFAGIFNAMAGSVFIDWIFMLGLLGIGLGLTLGIAMKLSCYSGSLMLLLMWLAVLPPEHHPFLDDHIIYALVLIYLANIDTKTKCSLGNWWTNSSLVQKYPWLE